MEFVARSSSRYLRLRSYTEKMQVRGILASYSISPNVVFGHICLPYCDLNERE
ncbi:hypothetical protein RSAG8_04502, partial [Rhizoctonia solani AG-8 WAC10335]